MLEGRHVIGLFLLMLVFSAVFFTLGYVMGRSQNDVRAATTLHAASDPMLPGKSGSTSKHAPEVVEAPDTGDTEPGWEILKPETKGRENREHPNTVSPAGVSPAAPKKTVASTNSVKPAVSATESPRAASVAGGYTLQVTAVRRESDALELARRLQKKKFPAFVLSPQGNKYYRVQVGPYADQKSAEAAKKGLENAGFKAIVKRG